MSNEIIHTIRHGCNKSIWHFLSKQRVARESLHNVWYTTYTQFLFWEQTHICIRYGKQFSSIETYDYKKWNPGPANRSLKTGQCRPYTLSLIFCLGKGSSPLSPCTFLSWPGSLEITVIEIMEFKDSNPWRHLVAFQPSHATYNICAHFFINVSTWTMQHLLLHLQTKFHNHSKFVISIPVRQLVIKTSKYIKFHSLSCQ